MQSQSMFLVIYFIWMCLSCKRSGCLLQSNHLISGSIWMSYIVCFYGLKYKVNLMVRSRVPRVWSAEIVNCSISHSSSVVLCGFYLIQRFCNPNSRVYVVFKMWYISKLGTKRIMFLRKCVICCTIRNAQRIHKRT